MPDGREIVFAGRDSSGSMRTYRQSVPDGVPKPLTPPGTFPLAVSPRGDQITGVMGYGDLRLFSLPGGEPRTVTTFAPGSFLCGWHALTFDHDPSDDEIVTQLPDPVDVTPTDVDKRRALILERAGYWLTLSQAATAASSDPAFTAGERTRLNALRDAARTALRAVL